MQRTILSVMLLVTAGLSMTVVGLGQGRQTRPALPAIEQVRDNLYVIMGGDPTDVATFSGGNVAVFVTEEHGVVVVDSKLPGYGQQIVDQIRTVTDEPITTMLHSHAHNDHSGSTPGFPVPVETITHENIKAAGGATECASYIDCDEYKGDGSRFLPARTFSDRMSLFSGNDRYRALSLRARAHQRRYVHRVPVDPGDALRRPIRHEAAPVHRRQ